MPIAEGRKSSQKGGLLQKSNSYGVAQLLAWGLIRMTRCARDAAGARVNFGAETLEGMKGHAPRSSLGHMGDPIGIALVGERVRGNA